MPTGAWEPALAAVAEYSDVHSLRPAERVILDRYRADYGDKDVLDLGGSAARLGVRRPVGYLRVHSLTKGGCVAWMLRLVKIGVEGEGPCTDVMEINRPGALTELVTPEAEHVLDWFRAT